MYVSLFYLLHFVKATLHNSDFLQILYNCAKKGGRTLQNQIFQYTRLASLDTTVPLITAPFSYINTFHVIITERIISFQKLEKSLTRFARTRLSYADVVLCQGFLITFKIASNFNRVHESTSMWRIASVVSNCDAPSVNSRFVNGEGTKGHAVTVKFSGNALQTTVSDFAPKKSVSYFKDMSMMMSLRRLVEWSSDLLSSCAIYQCNKANTSLLRLLTSRTFKNRKLQTTGPSKA